MVLMPMALPAAADIDRFFSGVGIIEAIQRQCRKVCLFFEYVRRAFDEREDFRRILRSLGKLKQGNM